MAWMCGCQSESTVRGSRSPTLRLAYMNYISVDIRHLLKTSPLFMYEIYVRASKHVWQDIRQVM